MTLLRRALILAAYAAGILAWTALGLGLLYGPVW